jgi:cytochrome c553
LSRLGAVLSLGLLLLSALEGCSSEASYRPPAPTDAPGDELARTWCGSCHAFPEPHLLDKETWRTRIMPEMASRLGLSPEGYNPYTRMEYEDLQVLLRTTAYPARPLLAEEDFAKIAAYYEATAPAELAPQPPKPAVTETLPGFVLKTVPAFQRDVPQTTLLKIDTARGTLFLGTRRNQLLRLDRQLRILDTLRVASPLADLHLRPDGSAYLLGMGLMDPNDQRRGTLQYWQPGTSPRPVLDSLARPVTMQEADLNADGRPDLIVGQFGNYLGRLSWYERRPDGSHTEHLLYPVSGTRQVLVRDLNADGRPDLLVLMAQGDEGVWAYYNQGGGRFRPERLLTFPPVYGSSYLETADFNGDGHLDLLYCNGDNADYSYTAKPYHAVRIFLNDGKNQFAERYTFPLNGASMARAVDFDQDGDLDLAVISHFPDTRQRPREGFVYLRNEGNLTFTPFTFPDVEKGKWLVMDAADVDGDGDVDLVLGSFLRLGWVEGQRRDFGLLLLENQTRRARP